jgi:hypothetical protein
VVLDRDLSAPAALGPGYQGRNLMAERGDRRIGGITIGGIVVIVGIVVALVWSILLGVIIAIVGLVAFGGFARGKWY